MSVLRKQLQAVLGDAFTIEKELTRGGMSHVFVAEEIALGRRIVVKVLDPDLAASVSVDRFKREVALTARLQDPHIVPIFSTGEVNGLPFYTMPFVVGDSLRSRIDRDGPLPLQDAVSILRDVALALECAHEQNVVHRDIKPDNVLLAGRSAIVTDFGVAKAFSVSANETTTTLTTLGMTLGTPAYMAPEQGAADPDIDHRADIYSYGILAYEMLTGTTPFAGRAPMAMIAAHITEEPTQVGSLRSGLPASLADLVMLCLRKEPEARPQTAGDVLAALAGIAVVGDEEIVPSVAAPLPSNVRTVGVLAFRNLSGSTENEYLSDGITEEILNALARVPALRVAARTSSFAFKGQDVDIKEIARKLRVGCLLEGSVRQAGIRLRVSAQLSNAIDGFQMWSERYDREITDVFEIQDEIASRIAASLQVALFDASGDKVATPHRASMDMVAYELYLRGRYFFNQRVDGMWKAVDFYQRALDRDPAFALAHTGVAEGHFMLALYNAVTPHEAAPKARASSLRALELEPNQAEAMIVLSNVTLWYDWNHAETIRLIERALHLKPSDALAHSCHAYYFSSLGRHTEAVERARFATELDPLGVFAQSNLAVINYLASRFADAVIACDEILEIAPNNSEAFRWRALSQFHLGQWQAAFESIEEAARLSRRHHWPLANQAAMLARAKRMDEARAILAELEERSAREPVPPLALATIHYGFGDLDAFFALLDQAIEARDFWLLLLNIDPGFAALRSHPKFIAAVRKITAG